MMIELNPLNVIQERKLSWCPPHFKTAKIKSQDTGWWAIGTPANDLEDWITFRLQGRYCIINTPTESGEQTTSVGFEDEKELTYFMLACPHI